MVVVGPTATNFRIIPLIADRFFTFLKYNVTIIRGMEHVPCFWTTVRKTVASDFDDLFVIEQ